LSDIRRKSREHPVQVGSLLEPRRETVNGKGMSQIMHAGLVASAVMTCNSRNPAKPLETSAQSVNVQRFAISPHEEIRALELLSSGRSKISSHDLVQVATDRNAPHSIESATG